LSILLLAVREEVQLAADDTVDDDDDNSIATIALGLFAFDVAADTGNVEDDESGALKVARESLWSNLLHFSFDFDALDI